MMNEDQNELLSALLNPEITEDEKFQLVSLSK